MVKMRRVQKKSRSRTRTERKKEVERNRNEKIGKERYGTERKGRMG